MKCNKVIPDKKVKVPDSWLAKADAGDPENTDLSNSTTLTARQGVILVTAIYVSPEQTRGESVDKRDGIGAFDLYKRSVHEFFA